MTVRNLGIFSVLIGILITSTLASAQAPATMPVYTGTLGGGLALTNGNTDTRNFNLTGAILRDPKTRNVMKAPRATFAELRATSSIWTGRRSTFGTSMPYHPGYLPLDKSITCAINSSASSFSGRLRPAVGYKLFNTDATQFIVDGGAGGVLEKNPGIESSKSGSVIAGQRFQHKLSSTAILTESLSSIWKTKDFDDSLTNFSAGITTSVVGKIQLKVEFIDSYKNKPPKVEVKKNDTAFVSTFVVKF
jgi:hypothetical protein